MLSKKEIEHIASLSRLEISGKEKEKFSKDLSVILDYVEKLNELDAKNIEPISQITNLKNTMRTDEKKSQPREIKDRILENVPSMKNGYVKVKTVL